MKRVLQRVIEKGFCEATYYEVPSALYLNKLKG